MSTLQSLYEAGLGAVASNRCHLLILTYHRVLDEKDPLLPDEPSVAEFEWQMRILKRYFNVLPLADAVAGLCEGALPARAVALTFDDGYRNNYEIAAPVLAQLGLPSTVFVATAYLDGGCMWNDVVIEAIRVATDEHLDLSELGLLRYPIGRIGERRRALDAILSSLKHRELEERSRAASDIARLCGLTQPKDMMMSSAQVAGISRFGIQVGAHTVNHPILARIPHHSAAQEITSSKRLLEGLTDGPVEQFAYPNGQPGIDYDESHAGLVRDAGFRLAVSTVPAVASRDSDPFQLPRLGAHRSGKARYALNLLASYSRTA